MPPVRRVVLRRSQHRRHPSVPRRLRCYARIGQGEQPPGAARRRLRYTKYCVLAADPPCDSGHIRLRSSRPSAQGRLRPVVHLNCRRYAQRPLIANASVSVRPEAAVSRVRRLRSLVGAVDPTWRSTTSQACRTTGGHEAPSARRSRQTSGWHARHPIFGAQCTH